jgi:hypothetical protein
MSSVPYQVMPSLLVAQIILLQPKKQDGVYPTTKIFYEGKEFQIEYMYFLPSSSCILLNILYIGCAGSEIK